MYDDNNETSLDGQYDYRHATSINSYSHDQQDEHFKNTGARLRKYENYQTYDDNNVSNLDEMKQNILRKVQNALLGD